MQRERFEKVVTEMRQSRFADRKFSEPRKAWQTDNQLSNIAATGKRTIDLKGYKGNMHKQTLSPTWNRSKAHQAFQSQDDSYTAGGPSVFRNQRNSKGRIETAVDKSRFSFTMHQTFQDNTSKLLASSYDKMTGKALSPTMRSGMMHSTMNKQPVPLMGKTVTNFAAIKYRDNGGLFPQS